MISDFMHYDTIALRQKKNAIWKVGGYNIRSVYMYVYWDSSDWRRLGLK